MKRQKVRVKLEFEISTNLDAATVQRRVEHFIDPERLAGELLGGEVLRILNTWIAVGVEPREKPSHG